MSEDEPPTQADDSYPGAQRAPEQVGERSDDSPTRILLLMAREANRQQLGSWFADRYEVETDPASITEALEQCDLCLMDDASFGRHREVLEKGKEAADPVFLPYVLVITETTRGDFSTVPWQIIDEVVRTPIRQAELQARTAVLLRARDYSLRLQRQNDRLEDFANTISHDLRNPLNVANGRLELAQSECDSEHLTHVEQAHNRMEALIADVLTLALEGATATETEVIELASTAEQCWQNVTTGTATLVTETDQLIYADQSRLQQLFENIVRNAIEHGRDDVTITVGDLPNGHGFYIEDDGPGMPKEVQRRAFESGYSTSDEGTGFGLTIVQEIADAHGWNIGVTDSKSGGVRFEITGVKSLQE